MQYLKLIWFRLAFFWRAVMSHHEEAFVRFEHLLKLIRDPDFTDLTVKQQFFAFCRMKPGIDYMKELQQALKAERPSLFAHLEASRR